MGYVLHFDLDSFFASVEQALHPKINSDPVAVSAGRGQHVITAVSYQARKFGIKTGMPLKQARVLCPSLVFVSARIEAYHRCGDSVKELISSTGAVIESLGVDECFLEISSIPSSFFPVELETEVEKVLYLAKWVKNRVKENYGLNISMGAGSSKVIAKLASDSSKPDGLRILEPSEELAFIQNSRIEDICGIGRRSSEKLHSMGVYSVLELSKLSQKTLLILFGPHHGKVLYHIAKNTYNDPIRPNSLAKSMSVMRSFRPPRLADEREIESSLEELILRLQNSGRCASRISVMIASSLGYGFDYINLGGATADREILVPAFRTLFQHLPKSQIIYLSLSLERLSDVEQLHLPVPLSEDFEPREMATAISVSDKLSKIAYRGMLLSHPVFGVGTLKYMEDSAITVIFQDRERQLELWAPLNY